MGCKATRLDASHEDVVPSGSWVGGFPISAEPKQALVALHSLLGQRALQVEQRPGMAGGLQRLHSLGLLAGQAH